MSLTPRAPRKAAAALLLCQQCWKPLTTTETNGLPKPHPCIFCNQCLQKCQPKDNDHQNGSLFWTYNIEQPGKLTKQRKEIILNASLQGSSEGLGMETESNVEAKSSEKQEIFRKTLRRFDKRATRCGHCKPDVPRRRLVEFCFHCHKYLCVECSEWHGKQRFYRLHATVDLTVGPNAALL